MGFIEKKTIISAATPSIAEGPIDQTETYNIFWQQIANANPGKNFETGGLAIRVKEHFTSEADELVKRILREEPTASVDSIVEQIKGLPYYQSLTNNESIDIPNSALNLFVIHTKS